MLQYPSYSQMNNMYAQPINPYAERMNFLQGYQQSLQQPQTQQSVIGKIVDSMDAVKAIDIPMDGNVYYFPKADGTEIFGKQWKPDCTTRILTYKPVLDAEPNNSSSNTEKANFALSDDVTEGIMKRFDNLESKLSEFETVFTNSLTKSSTKTVKTSTKKESEAE